jgi:hypothetical protein
VDVAVEAGMIRRPEALRPLLQWPLSGRLALVTSVCTFLGLLLTVQMAVWHYAQGHEVSWPDLLASRMTFWLAWIPGAMLVFPLARKYRLARGNLQRTLPAHLVGMLAVAALVGFGSSAAQMGLDQLTGAVAEPGMTPADYLYCRTLYRSFDAVVWYWVFVACFYTFDYANKYRGKRERTAALEGQLAQARLRMLTMQLHPHFFFNALNSVVALIRKDPEAAERLVVEFSHLVRLALNSTGKSEVTLKEELDFIGLYLAVEQARFQDRLVVKTLIDTETLDAVVPNMILQPLVENAIKYAVAPRREGGRVELRSWTDGRRVYLRVRDDGPGLPKTGPTREGVGLANTRARLREFYGEAARLDLRNAAGGGLAATLMLPLRTTGESLEVDEAGGCDDEDANAAGGRRTARA